MPIKKCSFLGVSVCRFLFCCFNCVASDTGLEPPSFPLPLSPPLQAPQWASPPTRDRATTAVRHLGQQAQRIFGQRLRQKVCMGETLQKRRYQAIAVAPSTAKSHAVATQLQHSRSFCLHRSAAIKRPLPLPLFCCSQACLQSCLQAGHVAKPYKNMFVYKVVYKPVYKIC